MTITSIACLERWLLWKRNARDAVGALPGVLPVSVIPQHIQAHMVDLTVEQGRTERSSRIVSDLDLELLLLADTRESAEELERCLRDSDWTTQVMTWHACDTCFISRQATCRPCVFSKKQRREPTSPTFSFLTLSCRPVGNRLCPSPLAEHPVKRHAVLCCLPIPLCSASLGTSA